MLVLSWKVPMGLVRRRTSRKRRLIALVVRLAALVLGFVAKAGGQVVEGIARG